MEFIKKHFTLVELKSVTQTFVANIGTDAFIGIAFNQVVGGDWSSAALVSLGSALFRSLVKAIWMVIFFKPAV